MSRAVATLGVDRDGKWFCIALPDGGSPSEQRVRVKSELPAAGGKCKDITGKSVTLAAAVVVDCKRGLKRMKYREPEAVAAPAPKAKAKKKA